jgi:hypothetical protein
VGHGYLVGWEAASDPVTVASVQQLIDEVTTIETTEDVPHN